MNLSIKSSLRNKLILSFFLLSLLPTMIVGLFNFEVSRSDDRTFLFAELTDINATKEHQIVEFIKNLTYQAQMLIEHPELEDLMNTKDETLLNEQVALLQHSLISSNFTDLITFSNMNDTMIRINQTTGYTQRNAFGDKGTAVYQLWSSAQSTKKIIIEDYYHEDDLSGIDLIMGIPTSDGAIVLTVAKEEIEEIVTFDLGKYESRESYLINSDYLILTEPTFSSTAKAFGTVYDNSQMELATKNSSFIDEIDDPVHGREIVLAAQAVDLGEISQIESDLEWFIISQIERSEMFSAATRRGWITVILIFGMGAIILIFGYFLLRSILHPIITLSEDVTRLADGYLDMDIKSERTDEIGILLNNTDFMVERIKTIVMAINDSIGKTNEIGMTIASSVEEQSAISVEQAGSITEISTTMDEFTSSFAQVTENVNSVSAMTEQIYTSINESANLMDSMADKIRDINVDNDRDIANIMDLKQRSKDIAKVMEIINNISDQTKIIAFNAALEASSAGEAGKRFAVVAAEIRKLTESVIESTGSIDQIISEIQNLADQMVLASEKTTKNIQKGLEYSNISVSNIDSMVESIRSTSDSSQQIALSVQQQQTAASQIQTGLQELSTGAQQNSAAIQALNETGSDFKRVGRQLSLMIKKFKFSKNDSQ